ncbi:DUF1501 domain-containing protein [Rhodopirellula sp. MGV]|uniref:DUF1501 domain-containing protein n=1 Tax=Rhodopirellula sp. MGV TaxID=2023130 RepID=UPI000B975D33|nr:DUF1501 domain-containing protein [Rhodopirellula sp. MGV]OYP28896.1 hypothetical protein CGZ80_25340 [Rhodopirellula sp. MGV]PNY36987.1 DUF1501 domain-containing protein [Rhodopirellula baltica]
MTFSRRSLLTRIGPASAFGMSMMRHQLLCQAAEAATQAGRHCIVLWMAGGPSQLDTFDMKPQTSVGGPLKETQTSVPGIRFSEHLPKLAQQAERLAILRGLTTKEGDHTRGAILMHTGNKVDGPVRYPAIGCALSKAIPHSDCPLPGYISVAPAPIAPAAYSPGLLGPKFAPTHVRSGARDDADEFASLKVDYLTPQVPVRSRRYQQRQALWDLAQQDFLSERNLPNVVAQDTMYRSALTMLESDGKNAFNLAEETDQVREAYGKGTFGQGCLMARRLIERGVPMVEVALGDGLGWDTHADNFEQVKSLSQQLDNGWATLMNELAERGLLERTTILWAGEFGRTPTINQNSGRDHFPQAFTCVLAGGGVKGGQVYGETAKDGSEVVDGRMEAGDLMATLCRAVNVDPQLENMTSDGRPIKISEGKVIKDVVV